MKIIHESLTVEDYTEVLKKFTTVQSELTEILNILEDEYNMDIIDDVDKEILIPGYEDTKKLLDRIKEYLDRS
jgi:hypothetical protein